jgi:hypothetical protein
MNLNLNTFFESVFNESRTTPEFNHWWFNNFSNGKDGKDFANKKVSAKIDFYPFNSLYDDFDDHFTTVLYDASKEKLPGPKAQEVALNKLRNELLVHFENRMNDYLENNNLSSNGDNDLSRDTDGNYSINYSKTTEFKGPHESLSEFVIDVDKEKPDAIKGTLLRTYLIKSKEADYLTWRIGSGSNGKVYSYFGKRNVISRDESPYVDDKIPLDVKDKTTGKDRFVTHTEVVKCHFTIKLIVEEPEA